MSKGTPSLDAFAVEAERVLALAPECRVNTLGGYGPNLEVIYEAHPPGCPSVLVDSRPVLGDKVGEMLSETFRPAREHPDLLRMLAKHKLASSAIASARVTRRCLRFQSQRSQA